VLTPSQSRFASNLFRDSTGISNFSSLQLFWISAYVRACDRQQAQQGGHSRR
jgi:hypothetical protein